MLLIMDALNKKKVIALVGAKGSGKSTVADIIKNIPNQGSVKEFPFADKLKKVCATVYGVPLKDFHDQKLKEKFRLLGFKNTTGRARTVLRHYQLSSFGHNKRNDLVREFVRKYPRFHSVRALMRHVGTELLRACNDEIHIETNIKLIESSGLVNVVIVPDVRFENELMALKRFYKENLRVLEIRRGGHKAGHSSEGYKSWIGSFDRKVIENNTNCLETLKFQVEKALMSLDCEGIKCGNISSSF